MNCTIYFSCAYKIVQYWKPYFHDSLVNSDQLQTSNSSDNIVQHIVQCLKLCYTVQYPTFKMTVLPLLDNQLNNKKQSQLKYVLSGGEINYDNKQHTGSGHAWQWHEINNYFFNLKLQRKIRGVCVNRSGQASRWGRGMRL